MKKPHQDSVALVQFSFDWVCLSSRVLALSLKYSLSVERKLADALRLDGLVEPRPDHAAVVCLIRDKAPIAGDRRTVLVKRFERAEDASGGVYIVGKIHRHGQLGAFDPLRRKRLAAVGQGNVLRQHFTLYGNGRFLQSDLPFSRQHSGSIQLRISASIYMRAEIVAAFEKNIDFPV